PLQITNGWNHPLAGKAIQCPEQHTIELALVGILEQLGESLAGLGTFSAGFVVDVFMHDRMTGVGAPLPQLPQLVLRVLAFVVGTNAGVDSYAHKHGSWLVE